MRPSSGRGNTRRCRTPTRSLGPEHALSYTPAKAGAQAGPPLSRGMTMRGRTCRRNDRLPADPGTQRTRHRRHLRGHRRRADGDLLDPEDRQLRPRRGLHDGRLFRLLRHLARRHSAAARRAGCYGAVIRAVGAGRAHIADAPLQSHHRTQGRLRHPDHLRNVDLPARPGTDRLRALPASPTVLLARSTLWSVA